MVLVIHDETFHCITQANARFCEGSQLWRVRPAQGWRSDPGAGGRIFLATLKGEVLQTDPTNGTIEKKYAVGSPVRSQPVIEGGRIYVGTQDGRIVWFDTGNAKFTGWNHWGCNAARTGASSEKK